MNNFKNHANTLALNSERLLIRKITSADFDEMVAHEQSELLMRYIRPITSLAETQAKVAKCIKDWHGKEDEWLMLCVFLPVVGTEQLIGMVCVKVESYEFKRMEIGYRFHQDFHGKGYAFETVKCVTDYLFNHLKIHKLLAYCVAEHSASYRLMEKLGMQQEACFRQHSMLGNQWHDELIYGLLASEYV